jgi:hypothetical protein
MYYTISFAVFNQTIEEKKRPCITRCLAALSRTRIFYFSGLIPAGRVWDKRVPLLMWHSPPWLCLRRFFAVQ